MKHLVLTVCLVFTIAAVAQSDRTFVQSKLAAEKRLPFSSAVRVGDTLYVAGTTAEPKNLAAGLTPEQEASELMEQVKETVEKSGMTMNEVVSVQVFCTDLSLYQTFNGPYRKYFGENFPARSFLGVAQLLFGARFEVNAVAVARAKDVKK